MPWIDKPGGHQCDLPDEWDDKDVGDVWLCASCAALWAVVEFSDGLEIVRAA